MTTRTATPAKLRDGSWGARVTGGAIAPGSIVTIETKAGKTWTALVESVVWTDGQVSLVRTRSTSPAPTRRRRMGPGHGQAAPVAGYSRYCTDNDDCECYDCAS